MNKLSFYASIKLKNPIIAASAGTTRNLKHCLLCEDAGFSAIVLKSVQEEVLMRYNPFPRFGVLRSGVKDYESCTFYSYEQAYEGDIDHYCNTIQKVRERLSIPVIASINCINPETWPEYAASCEQAGADALEIVPSCPTGKLVRESTIDIQSIIINALISVKRAVSIPVIPKMTRQLADILGTMQALDELGADGITLMNRSTGIDIEIDSQAPILHGGYAGHGGSWSLYEVMRWIIAARRALIKAPICATGGIMTGDDVIKCLLAGAKSVQIASVIYLKGYEWVSKMLRRIDDYMEEKEINSLSDIVGLAADKMKTMEEYNRISRYSAYCDVDKCVQCGSCSKVCIYEALVFSVGGPRIDVSACDGCGLCASVCRSSAISMVGKE